MTLPTSEEHPSCFPVMSFLHVPGKMSQPLWLMMGTAFLLRTGHAAGGNRRFFLSAKHTFAPWEYLGSPDKLKIPEAYRKTRFVIGRLYLTDCKGKAMATSAAELQLVALHPTLDVALLALRAPPPSLSLSSSLSSSSPISSSSSLSSPAAGDSKGPESDVHVAVERRAALTGGGLTLSPSDPQKGDVCVVRGYGGVGPLGLLDTTDPELLQRLPAAQRDELLAALKCVEGQQVAATAAVEVLHASGICRATHGRCYHGMSGGPVLVNDEMCGGILYGKHAEHTEHLGYTPAHSFSEWLSCATGTG
ncbi:uncharacterized protein TM35_000232460 [Trypanosoma theileri]|uniref:Uncharacterized protein n=1 Tax=Trypanosoma theileri TaxID=67003 RepID=A0A1X0NRD6_9TRYP|nr:uncharacterized protein TM35_000232460 [Trypanosoma theileri]ORC87275.1 hypothetical protein TM35_000232460 [Trypanosoma theileri]